MAISFVNSATGQNSGAGVTSVTVTLPSGLAENDVVFAYVYHRATTNRTFSEGGGTWTKLADIYSDDTRDTNYAVFRKIMGATPDTSVTITTSGAAVANWLYGAVAYRGEDTAQPEDVTTVSQAGINTGQVNSNSITPVTNNCVIVTAGASTSSTSGLTITVPANYTERISHQHSSDGFMSAVWGDRVLATAAAEDPGFWTFSNTTNSDSYSAVTIAIKPAADVPPGPALNANPFMLLGVGRKLP